MDCVAEFVSRVRKLDFDVCLLRKDRVTVAEREADELKQRELEAEAKKQVEERRRYTLKIVEEEAKKEFEENRRTLAALDSLDTDGENEEEEYEAWKVRELKRIKRDREAREAWVQSDLNMNHGVH